MTQPAQRLPLIDALKAIAALLVLLTHFSSYGPLAAAGHSALPGLFAWCYDYGRMAVQVFLVIAGFLAVRALSPDGQPLAQSPWPLLGKRYRRLIIPYFAALVLAIAAAAVADIWLDDEAIPAPPSLAQLLAHLLLLHSLLGVDALSAGVWYIAIDFQLFALMALLLWAGRRDRLAPALVLGVAVLSLFWFNLDTGWDNWAIYFFGSYGLGAAAWWAAGLPRARLLLALLAAVTIAALLVNFRLRIELALSVALLLGFARHGRWLERWPDVGVLNFLGRISYSLFLVHFPVLLLANALYAGLALATPGAALVVLLAALLASIGVATLFHRWIESPEAGRRITAALGRRF
ncbi:MAG: GTP cyclohydrolase [Betaproteobacteria bacterium HGW-Betaproteobacteria-12]|nr:MAG: GTP cyclohydrolase [Betaproteobacteria bacterium HGW-Betaproteobacteria-12]